jgi:VWFA-related protein
MSLRRRHLINFCAGVAVSVLAASVSVAQQPAAQPSPPVERETQETEKVFTEEVRIPIFATDEKGRFDPTLELDEVLVLEDDVPQEIRSVRRIPASVLLVVGTGGDMNPAIRTSTSRALALNLLSNLREGDQVALIQFNTRVEGLQKWTTDKSHVEYALRERLKSGSGSKLSQAIILAASYFENQPMGNRHLVLVTDGVEMPARLSYKEAMKALEGESPEARAQAAEAIKQLNAAQATVHVISYTAYGRQIIKERKEKIVMDIGPRAGGVASSGIATVGIDPTLPPGMNRGGASAPIIGGTIRFDPQMRKLNKAYESATKRSEKQLASFTEETGGRLWLPTSSVDMIEMGAEVAREIGSQYVITYRPKRPLASAPPNEYRRIRVAPRRIGLQLRARRGYVVASMR